jgi:hypothetical protein
MGEEEKEEEGVGGAESGEVVEEEEGDEGAGSGVVVEEVEAKEEEEELEEEGGDKGKGWLANANFRGGKLSSGAPRLLVRHCYIFQILCLKSKT